MTREQYQNWQKRIRQKRTAEPVFLFVHPTHKLVAVRFCRLPNGDRRYAQIKTPGKPTASIKIGGKTVSGTITYDGDYHFHPNPQGKNAELLAA